MRRQCPGFSRVLMNAASKNEMILGGYLQVADGFELKIVFVVVNAHEGCIMIYPGVAVTCFWDFPCVLPFFQYWTFRHLSGHLPTWFRPGLGHLQALPGTAGVQPEYRKCTAGVQKVYRNVHFCH